MRPARLELGLTITISTSPSPRTSAGPTAAFPPAIFIGARHASRSVQTSDAEFSVAQGIYVATDSGWFSDRTIRYLASGKPALVQDTGFSRNYPVGEGLVAFSTLEQAVVGAQRIVREYAAHCQAARALAERYFDSEDRKSTRLNSSHEWISYAVFCLKKKKKNKKNKTTESKHKTIRGNRDH